MKPYVTDSIFTCKHHLPLLLPTPAVFQELAHSVLVLLLEALKNNTLSDHLATKDHMGQFWALIWIFFFSPFGTVFGNEVFASDICLPSCLQV